MNDLKLGQTVSNINLPLTTGETFNLEKFRQNHPEKWTLVINFRGSWCPACMAEIDSLVENESYFDKKDINIVLISDDTMENLKTMAEEKHINYPVLADDQSFAEAYGVYRHENDDLYADHGAHNEPAYFLISEDGRLLYQHKQTGPFGRPAVTELRKTIQYIKKTYKNA